ncbi:MAG: ribE [Bacteroidetes bacterium]|nr:ribE [Bacteroidota bacterium]
MFTGIITYQGIIQKKTASKLRIKAEPKLLGQLVPGVSIAVNGVCLTISKIPNDSLFEVDVMPETMKRTMLGSLRLHDTVNLELSVKANSRLAGHIVQGHIDGTATIKSIKREGNSRVFSFTTPRQLLKYMVEKGSVAVNGISLTLIEVTDRHFTVGIIPFTRTHTMFRYARVGDSVNIEVDILAKYVYKLVQPLIGR